MRREKILIFDTTLRDGEQASGFHMYPEQKLEIAKDLASMGVDIMEVGNPISSPGDYKAVRRICEHVKGPTIAALARCVDADIESACTALEPAIRRGKGRVHVYIATSNIHTEKKLRKSRENVMDMVHKNVSKAREFTDDIQFSPEDFTRSEHRYTVDVISRAIEAGAKTINLPDTVGYSIMSETRGKVQRTIDDVKDKTGRDDIVYSIHCHNDIGLATANTIEAILGGARQLEVTVNGIGERAGNAALEECVAIIRERPDYFEKELGYNVYTNIETKKIFGISRKVASFTNSNPQRNKAIVGNNAFSHEAGVHQDGMTKDSRTYEWINPKDYGARSKLTFGPRSGRKGLMEAYRKMGIKLNNGDLFNNVFERFTAIADREKEIDHYHLANALSGKAMIPYYKLVSAKTWSDNSGGSARIVLSIDGRHQVRSSSGSGMIDASVKAINSITGYRTDIIDYKSISAAIGSKSKGVETVVVRNNGFEVGGHGCDSDVVMGSIKAYVDAVNKIRYVSDTFKEYF
ncbi:MAG: 2-isopropylmalate synthase [Candidatus Aenigmatarchaeota archaeon]